jgi:glycosyltransferase involved in cell wall biosynthesis
MKIVYLSSSTIPSRTANSIHVMKMCQAFVKNGHEVVLVVTDKKNEIEPGITDVYKFYGVDHCFDIITIPQLPIKLLGRGIAGLRAGMTAKRYAPDVVYSRCIIGCSMAAILGLPVIFESHSPVKDSNIFCDWLLRGLLKAPQFRKMIVISEALKKYYEQNYLRSRGAILVAPDAADPVPSELVSIDLPNKGKRMQVGYVGHLYRGRGIELIVSLAKKCQWSDFHLVGGTKRDIVFWKKNTEGQSNIFFHGFVTPSEAISFQRSFDVLLAPYQSAVSISCGVNTVNWMSPLKVFEYMAAAKAIVSSDLPVLREVLKHEKNALLCPPADMKCWEKALVRLRDDRKICHQLGMAAMNDFLSQYTWDARAQRVLKPVC